LADGDFSSSKLSKKSARGRKSEKWDIPVLRVEPPPMRNHHFLATSIALGSLFAAPLAPAADMTKGHAVAPFTQEFNSGD